MQRKSLLHSVCYFKRTFRRARGLADGSREGSTRNLTVAFRPKKIFLVGSDEVHNTTNVGDSLCYSSSAFHGKFSRIDNL